MPILELRGCTPEPLGNYLKGLGVFRLIAEQADPQARAWWKDGVLVLHTKLSREELIDFFLHGIGGETDRVGSYNDACKGIPFVLSTDSDNRPLTASTLEAHRLTEPTSPRQFFPVTEAPNEYPSLPKRRVTSDVRYEGASLKAAATICDRQPMPFRNWTFHAKLLSG